MGAINNDKAMKSILEGVDYMIKKAIKDAPSDKIYVATVLEAKNNNLYKIQLKDKVYDNIPSLFQDIIQNEPVRVVVPQNNYNQMFILGKHNMDSIGDYNNLKNKPQINGVELKGNKTAKDLGLVSEAMLAEFFKDREYKAGEYTIYQGEMYKAKKNTSTTKRFFKPEYEINKAKEQIILDDAYSDRAYHIFWSGNTDISGCICWYSPSYQNYPPTYVGGFGTDNIMFAMVSPYEDCTYYRKANEGKLLPTHHGVMQPAEEKTISEIESDFVYGSKIEAEDGTSWWLKILATQSGSSSRPHGFSTEEENKRFVEGLSQVFKPFDWDERLLYTQQVLQIILDQTLDEQQVNVPPYDTTYWEKIPNVMSQIIALARMYNDLDAYSKGDYAMYDGDLYKLTKDTNDNTGVFYPYKVSESESQNHSQIVSMDNDGKGEYYTGIEGSGAIIWFQCSNRSTPSSPPYIYMLLSQDPNFTVAEIKQSDYNSDWFQNILNDPTSASYDNYIKGVWDKVSTETTRNNYCRQYTLDNGETWYLRLSRVHFGSGEVPQFQQGTREYGIHISVDTSIWFYSGSGASQNNILTRDFLEYVLSVIITKGAKQPPTNSDYWRKVDYLMDEVTDYNNLRNKPKINGHELIGDKSTADLEILPPIASKTQFGGVVIGDGIDVDETGKISIDGDLLPTPTLDGNIMVVENEEWIQKPLEDVETDPTVPQYVKDITEEDIEKWNQGGEIPIASATQLGGVKIGSGITITEDGTISAQGGGGSGLPVPTANDNILVSKGTDWEQKNISTSTIPSFTKAEYALLKDTIPTGTRFIITDDNEPQTAIRSDGLEIYSGAWIADRNSSLSQPLTETLNVTKGKYLVICQFPHTQNDNVFWGGILLNNANSGNWYIRGGSIYNSIFVIDAPLDENSIVLVSTQLASMNFQYKERGFIKAIKLDTLFDASAPSDIYSTDEKIIGKWTNDKPLYQKTYVLNNISSSTSDWTKLLEVEGADNIISIDGFAIGTLNQQKLQINSVYISTMTSNNIIKYYTQSIGTWSYLDFTITVQYTKGSD